MEKSTMDRRYPLHGPRLLSPGIALLCFLQTALLPAQTEPAPAEEEPLRVEVQLPLEEPALGDPWVITFLVDHPSPGEVTVQYPPLPGGLSLESIRTGSQRVEGKRWTAVEFWFIPQRPGTFTLEPFEVLTPNKGFVSEPFFLYIQGSIREYRPVFFWENPPRSLQIGERAAVALRLVNWNPQKPLPRTEGLHKEIPEQVILEELPLSPPDQGRGIILRLGIIPLGGRQFTLKPLEVHHEGLTLEVPGLRIPILPRKQERPAVQGDVPMDASPAETEGDLDFPEITGPVFPLFRADYERGLAESRSLWREGRIPEALAEMRRNERENLAGARFTPLRQEAERRLGLDLTQDEPWRPRKLIGGILLGSLGLLILLGIRVFVKGKTVTSRLPWGYTSIVMGLLLLVSAALFLWVKGMHGGERGSAVLREATAYRVPDSGGGVSASFREGQPALIRALSESWVYVESFDGRLGWVLRDKVIVY